MPRYAMATVASLRKAIEHLPEGSAIGTNAVGNLSVCVKGKDGWLKTIGYIELLNIEIEGCENFECEFTPITD